MFNEISTYQKSKVLASAVVILSLCLLVPASVPTANAQFVIAWTYGDISGSFDEYGQGFYSYIVYENVSSPPVWVSVGGTRYFNESTTIDWEVGYPIQIRVLCWMNSTLTGAIDLADGLNYQRVNVSVTDSWNTVLYEEDDIANFYKTAYFDAVMWYYGFETILGFLPTEGMVYTVAFTYEIYW